MPAAAVPSPRVRPFRLSASANDERSLASAANPAHRSRESVACGGRERGIALPALRRTRDGSGVKRPGSRLVGVLLLASIGVLSGAPLLRRSRTAAVGGAATVDVGAYLTTLEPLRRELPAHGTVGYQSDLDDALADREEVKRFYLTQYAVAPVVVVPDTRRNLVIGNYGDPSRCRLCRSPDFVVAKDFGNGLMLFRKSGR